VRYAFNTDSFRPNGTIFFVPGGQGTLGEEAFEQVGFLWDVAPLLDAAVVVAEQRFYGYSKPYQLKRNSYNVRNVNWTWEQLQCLDPYEIVYDNVDILTHFIRKVMGNAPVRQIITVGVHYSGMQAYWLALANQILHNSWTIRIDK